MLNLIANALLWAFEIVERRAIRVDELSFGGAAWLGR